MHDLIIKQAKIIDGTGKPGWIGDVGIKNDKFAAVESSLEATGAKQTIEGKGLALSPGFIDIHTHSDDCWVEDCLCEIKLQQGVTREILGNCGVSLAPMGPQSRYVDFQDAMNSLEKHKTASNEFSFKAYRTLLGKKGLSNNLMGLIGHGTLRIAVMGFSNTTPTQDQMNKMKTLMDEAMDQGAIGLSTGLIYAPGIFAGTPELVELCRIISKKKRVLCHPHAK